VGVSLTLDSVNFGRDRPPVFPDRPPLFPSFLSVIIDSYCFPFQALTLVPPEKTSSSHCCLYPKVLTVALCLLFLTSYPALCLPPFLKGVVLRSWLANTPPFFFLFFPRPKPYCSLVLFSVIRVRSPQTMARYQAHLPADAFFLPSRLAGVPLPILEFFP